MSESIARLIGKYRRRQKQLSDEVQQSGDTLHLSPSTHKKGREFSVLSEVIEDLENVLADDYEDELKPIKLSG